MAKYIPIGQPINRAEENGLRSLRDLLPDHYTILGSFDLNLDGRSNSLEFDAVVIGEHSIYAIEIKGWAGKIQLYQDKWELDWGRMANPFINLEKKAKALRSFLGETVDDFPNIPVESIVLLPRSPELSGDISRENIVCGLTQILERFSSEAKIYELGPGPFLEIELRNKVISAMIPLSSPSTELRVVSDYEILGEIENNKTDYEEFIGRHKLLKSRSRVRIKRYSMDPLATVAERQRSFEHILRDMEAITELEENPYVARGYDVIRDRTDELNFYLVGEWVGTKTLESISRSKEDIFRGEERRTSINKLAIHLLRGLAFMHKKGIVHRNLRSSVVYITKNPDIPLKIADFEFARISHLPTILGDANLNYNTTIAPELWRGDDHDHRVDIFSCGCILFEIFTGEQFVSSLSLPEPSQVWEEKLDCIEDNPTREILGRCFEVDPDDRPTISELLTFFGGVQS